MEDIDGVGDCVTEEDYFDLYTEQTYHTITEGTCDSHGYYSVSSKQECETVAEVMGNGPYEKQISSKSKTGGCVFSANSNAVYWVTEKPSSKTRKEADDVYQYMCVEDDEEEAVGGRVLCRLKGGIWMVKPGKNVCMDPKKMKKKEKKKKAEYQAQMEAMQQQLEAAQQQPPQDGVPPTEPVEGESPQQPVDGGVMGLYYSASQTGTSPVVYGFAFIGLGALLYGAAQHFCVKTAQGMHISAEV